MSSKSSPPREQRRRFYIDPLLQGRLIAGLVLLELVLFSVALLLIYRDLQQVLSEQIFRAHGVPTGSLPVLAAELLTIAPYVLVANVVMVACVYWVWTRAVKRVVEPLKGMLTAIAHLDLRPRSDLEGQHDLLAQARGFLAEERARSQEVRGLVAALEPASSPDERARILVRLRGRLK